MKIAVSGKGGVGKSTVAAGLALLLSERGRRVLAVDADPDANLAAALGVPTIERHRIVSIADRKALIEERTGARVSQYGQVFKLNPEVADIAGICGYSVKNVRLVVLGAIRQVGGCACPESVLLKGLVQDLVLYKDEDLVLDMEAGIEHLGRATTRGVDCLLVVVEPGQRSIDCALRVRELASQIGISRVLAVANKVSGTGEADFIETSLDGRIGLVGLIPYSDALRAADREGLSVLDSSDERIRGSLESILRAVGSADGNANKCKTETGERP